MSDVSPAAPAGSTRQVVGTSIASDSRLGIRGPSLRQGGAGTQHFEPGGVSFRDFRCRGGHAPQKKRLQPSGGGRRRDETVFLKSRSRSETGRR
jgi:hypothetical protein